MSLTTHELSAQQQELHPAAVLLERRKLRRSFEAWCRYRMAKIDRQPAAHHILIIQTIEKLLRNELRLADGRVAKNVMFLMPPGSAKSTYTSVELPAWFLNPEQFPHDLMLACSYSYQLIEGFGGRARDIVESESNILGITVSKKDAAAGDWRINYRGREDGGYRCAGVNAGIAGNRARLGFIDDYIGSQEEADSQLIRDKNWEWYWNDFWPRLLPDAWQFIIANRRHEDDLVGRLLNEEGNDWLVVRLPMLAEDNDPLGRKVGERLWPEWFTEQQVDKARKQPRTWAGLYQQRPAPEEGNYFRADSIWEYSSNELPPLNELRIYVGSDYAVRKGQDSDKFCFIPAGLDSHGMLWILPDWFWQTSDTLEACHAQLDMGAKHRPICWWGGRENITGSIAPFLYKLMQERNIYVPIEELSESRDKEQKAQPIKALMQAKKVRFPKFAKDWADAKHQLLTFPGGMNDDFVDALAKLGQGISKMVPGSLTTREKNLSEVLDVPLTCGWVERSHKRRQRTAARLDLMEV